jgi:FixJ family two-component response regulator
MDGRPAIVDAEIAVRHRLTKSLAKRGFQVEALMTAKSFMARMVQI